MGKIQINFQSSLSKLGAKVHLYRKLFTVLYHSTNRLILPGFRLLATISVINFRDERMNVLFATICGPEIIYVEEKDYVQKQSV